MGQKNKRRLSPQAHEIIVRWEIVKVTHCMHMVTRKVVRSQMTREKSVVRSVAKEMGNAKSMVRPWTVAGNWMEAGNFEEERFASNPRMPC